VVFRGSTGGLEIYNIIFTKDSYVLQLKVLVIGHAMPWQNIVVGVNCGPCVSIQKYR
jgi:hypothetical protein